MGTAFRRKSLTPLLVLTSCSVCFAGVPANYYASADATNAATLRASLNDIVTAGHVGVLFSNTLTSFAAISRVDADHGDPSRVRLIYSHDTRPQGDNSPTPDGDPATGSWERHHVFPPAFFNSVEPVQGDLHAIFPGDLDLDISRSSRALDTVTSPSYTDVFGNRADASLFEPRDSMKGDIARALFYLDIRYEGEGSEPDLKLINSAPGGSGAGEMAYLNTLLAWHNADPPDAFEVTRNNRVYDEQGNANPFVDHPEWVNIVYGSAAPSVTDGNTVTVSVSNIAPSSIGQGAASVPLLRFSVALSSGEYDVDQIDIQQIGTIADSQIESIEFFHDADNSGTISAGDIQLGSNTLTASATTLTALAPLRMNTGTARILVTASLRDTAPAGATVRLRAVANGLRHSSRGGNDIDPTYGVADSSAATVQSSAAGAFNSLIISEVFEGTAGSLKYVEIHNPTAFAVDLDDPSHDIVLRRYSNANLSSTSIDLTGTIAAGGYFVIANNSSDFDPVFGASFRQQISTSIDHDGNDKYDLFDSTGGLVIDSFAADNLGNSTSFADDLVAFRINSALPNNGNWGGTAKPSDGGNSASGYWTVIYISASNGNAATAGSPGTGAGQGAPVPVELSSFRIE